ncbi:c-type cytochrome biogenesis protein CcmI [Palleronia sediminis]|uniref:C-type cytochrome biogenesis protein CcmI n=1 Tax=Palleronia sediminis TaxID=2547833 RepID=A0A4R6A7B2_9RHOB|nr:c-type cytochrome biogenesis protein CcmI [Palleronia sediminis]TDL78068.1 c-type cytochrome biogenesis protein CcmI [Palleronia sediminis]
MIFWLAAFALAALCAVPILAALLRRREEARDAPDIAVYRDQLDEVERDRARGLLTDAEAARARTEVERRLIEADRAGPDRVAPAPGWARLGAAGFVAVAAIAGGGALYLWQGAPGYGDLPLSLRLEQAEQARAARPTQAEAEARATPMDPPELSEDYAALMERLRRAVADRPGDTEGLRLLARNELNIGNYAAAARAQEQLIALLGDAATAEDHARLGEALALAAGGVVTPEGEAALDAALARDPASSRALYLKGLGLAQTGRPDLTFRLWRDIAEGRATPDPQIEALVRQRIGDIAAQAGIRYEPPAAGAAPGPGPDAAAMEAAADMTPEERQEMIEGMVSGLMERLGSEGGPATDWARLIGALVVLGRQDRARAIYDEAVQVFADDPASLDTVEQAGAQAGIAP